MTIFKYLFASSIIALASCNTTNAKTETATEAEPVETETQDAEATAEKANTDAVVIMEKGATKLPKAGKMPVIVDFSATWCGPCQRFKPTFHKVAEEFKGKALFVSVDVDDCRELATTFGVESIPYIVAIAPKGAKTEKLIGYLTYEQFKEFVEKAIATK